MLQQEGHTDTVWTQAQSHRRGDTLAPIHKHRSTWTCLMHSGTGMHTHACAPTWAHVPGQAPQDADTQMHTSTHRRAASWARCDAHGQQGPGEPATG